VIQVIYVRYGKTYIKEFSGETEREDSLSFIDHLRSEFFDGGVVLGVVASEWQKSQVGESPTRGSRVWWSERHAPDIRLEELIEHEFAEPCQHCDHWCRGTCRGARSCLQSGKPGHVHCSSRLITSGLLTPRR
jgi:hypothetical protein